MKANKVLVMLPLLRYVVPLNDINRRLTIPLV